MPSIDSRKPGATDYDVTYSTVDGVVLGMDIYYPNSGGPWPALIFVHGGGWTEGDKSGVLINPSQFGYLVASINYRLYPAFRFPAMIEDVKCAIRFLRANANRYNLDPERIGLVGHSAGSHLAALAGLADESAGWDVGQHLDQTSRVQAVIAVSGPSDLRREFPDWVEELKHNVFGLEQLVSGSPITYTNPNAPPFLIIHGECDPAVPVEQGILLRDALAPAGVPVDLLIVQNGGHGLEPLAGPVKPSIEAIYQKAFEFLDTHLFFTGKIRPPPFLQKRITRIRLIVRILIAKIQGKM
jgi:acetyl esterase/lipase